MIQFNLTALNMVEAKLPPCKVAELRTARSYVVSSPANLFSCPGSAAGAAALKFGSAGSPRVRWQMRHERPRATRALWWGAPQAADPPMPGAEKHQKSFRRVGESFLDGIRVAHKRLQEQNPAPPPFGGYLKSEKSAVLTHFSDDFSLFESHKML